LLATPAAIAGCGLVFPVVAPPDPNQLEWELRHGTVTGKVVGVRPFHAEGDNLLMMGGEGCGGGDIGYVVQPDGAFNVPCLVGRRAVLVVDYADADHPMIIGEGDVLVLPMTTTSVTIQLHEPRLLRPGG
jgi:hypothetical protein